MGNMIIEVSALFICKTVLIFALFRFVILHILQYLPIIFLFTSTVFLEAVILTVRFTAKNITSRQSDEPFKNTEIREVSSHRLECLISSLYLENITRTLFPNQAKLPS